MLTSSEEKRKEIAMIPTRPQLFTYLFGWLLAFSWSCSSLKSLDATYPVNPVAAETPVYRDADDRIIIDLALLSDTIVLPVTIYHGLSYEDINRTEPIGVSHDYSFVWEGPEDQQHFFEIVSASGASVVVAERLIHFEGTENTRDLGGYRTRDGHTVRWGHLYRSGDLGSLKRSDLDYWQNVGIREVIDFREPEALARKPDRLPSDDIVVQQFAVYDTSTTRRKSRKLLQRADPDEYNAETILLENNRMYVTQYTPAFAKAFAELLEQPESLLYHCSAGKDRTGFMSAMLLYALGVPRATIMRDYMASNYYRQKRIRRRARLSPLIGISPRVSLPLLEVRPIYLEAALRTVEEQYGSIDNYLKEGLGISDDEREKLREKYLD